MHLHVDALQGVHAYDDLGHHGYRERLRRVIAVRQFDNVLRASEGWIEVVGDGRQVDRHRIAAREGNCPDVVAELHHRSCGAADCGEQPKARRGMSRWFGERVRMALPVISNPVRAAGRSGANWIGYDGQGHTYTFTEPAGHPSTGLWLLTTISGPAGTMMQLSYDVRTVALTGGNAMSVDLTSIAYNFNPALGCAKDVIELSYGDDSPKPLSISVMPKVVVRMHTLQSIDVQMHSSCLSKKRVRHYA